MALKHPASPSPAQGAGVRARAAQAVAGVLGKGERLEAGLVYDGLSQPDRALLRELATGTVRWAIRLRALLEGLLDRGLPKGEDRLEALLLVGLYQLAHTGIPPYAAVSATVGAVPGGKAWARRLVNGVLRRFGRERETRLAAVDRRGLDLATAHPRWLAERLREAYPRAWEEILAANNRNPPLTLRVRGDREAYLGELAAAGLPAEPVPGAPKAVRLAGPCPVGALPGFAGGRVSVQDAAAQLAAELVDPRAGETVLDACSAPGGKLAHLLDRAPGARIIGVDADPERLEKARETVARLGLEPAALIVGDAARPGAWWEAALLFDRILVDAPCTGTGVIRRHPDIKHRRRPEDEAVMARRQRALLEGLWPWLRPGGRLVYATCSVLPGEGPEVVAQLLERFREAATEALPDAWGRPAGPGRQILPGEGEMDGFFYASLTKTEAP